MNPTQFASKIKGEMEAIKHSMVEPGFSDMQAYRESLAKYHAFKAALKLLKTELDEDSASND